MTVIDIDLTNGKMPHLLCRSNAKETLCNFLNNLNYDQCDIMTVESPFGKTILLYIQENESVVIKQLNPQTSVDPQKLTKQKGPSDISTIKYMAH